MKKKIVMLAVTVLMVLAIGCSPTEEVHGSVSASTFELEFVATSHDVNEYRDTETGVHYLIYRNASGYAGMGGICPRYNADGTLYVD